MTRSAELSDSNDPAVEEKWRRIRGLGSLDRRRLAVVRDLFAWREQTAERTNRPTRAICRDDLLVEIARRNPTRPRDLQVIRGLPHRHLDAIFQVMVEARKTPPDQYPAPVDRDQDPPQVGWVTNILLAVLGDLCVRQKLAANLVATNADVKALVRSRLRGDTSPPTSLLTQGWRSAHILPELLSVLEGRRSVRIGNVKAEAPLSLE